MTAGRLSYAVLGRFPPVGVYNSRDAAAVHLVSGLSSRKAADEAMIALLAKGYTNLHVEAYHDEKLDNQEASK